MASLENIKAGDTVIYCRGRQRTCHKVTRVTKMQVIVGTLRFRKSTGFPVGSFIYLGDWIRLPAHEEEIYEIGKEALKQRLICNITEKCTPQALRELSWETLEKLQAVLEAPT